MDPAPHARGGGDVGVLVNWLRQTSTIAGIATLCGLGAAWAAHALTRDFAVAASAYLGVRGLVMVAMPENPHPLERP